MLSVASKVASNPVLHKASTLCQLKRNRTITQTAQWSFEFILCGVLKTKYRVSNKQRKTIGCYQKLIAIGVKCWYIDFRSYRDLSNKLVKVSKNPGSIPQTQNQASLFPKTQHCYFPKTQHCYIPVTKSFLPLKRYLNNGDTEKNWLKNRFLVRMRLQVSIRHIITKLFLRLG